MRALFSAISCRGPGLTGCDDSNNNDASAEAAALKAAKLLIEHNSTDEDTGLQGFAKNLYSIHLPATATSVSVPAVFMQSGKAYEYEVLVIEESGTRRFPQPNLRRGKP